MKSLLLSALYSALKAYLGSGVYNRIAAEVMAQMQYTGLSGAEKMAGCWPLPSAKPLPPLSI
jgi:hypothetical protein